MFWFVMHVVARADQAEYSRTKCKMRHRQATTARDKLELAEADVRSEERARVMVTGEEKRRARRCDDRVRARRWWRCKQWRGRWAPSVGTMMKSGAGSDSRPFAFRLRMRPIGAVVGENRGSDGPTSFRSWRKLRPCSNSDYLYMLVWTRLLLEIYTN
jgi:hypothetical protein